MTCVERMNPDPEVQSRILNQLQDYRGPSNYLPIPVPYVKGQKCFQLFCLFMLDVL